MFKGKLKRTLIITVSVLAVVAVSAGVFYYVNNTYFGANNIVYADTPAQRSGTKPDAEYVKSVSDLGTKVLYELARTNRTENKMVSPLGMSMCYSMLLSGAEGNTYDELKALLSYGDMADDKILRHNKAAFENIYFPENKDVKLNISNAIWADKGYNFRQEFLDGCRDRFYSDIYEQDFSDGAKVVKNINKWVKNKSDGIIDSIIDSLDSDAVMCLINSIYFEGKWEKPFEKSKTASQTFYLEDGGLISCDFMHSDGSVKYLKSEIFEAVSIPYEGGEYSMILAMPGGDSDILNLLNEEQMELILRNREWEYAELIMPKFKFMKDIDMKPLLQSLGVKDAFGDNADFSKIDEKNDLQVGTVKQKTFIDVNEEKTIAIAINFVSMNTTAAAPTEPVVFNRPFVFFIADESGLPLFMGIANNPSEN